MKLQCHICGVELSRTPSQVKASRTGLFYCSEHRPNKPNRVIVQCAQCGVDIERWPSKVNELNYCAPECRYEAQRRRVIVQCVQCGVDIERRCSEVKKRNYCSYKCHDEAEPSEELRAKMSLITSKRLAANKQFRSRIEFIVEEHLTRWGFDFTTQKPLRSPAGYPEGSFGINCDFYLPGLGSNGAGVAIECNGGYFHSDPVRYPDRDALDQLQRDNLLRYERKKRLLAHMGIRLIELWERDNAHARQVVIAPLLLLACQPGMKEVA